MSRAGPIRSEAVADSRFPASFSRASRKDQTGPRGPHAAALIVVLVVAVAGVLTMFAEVALGVVVALLSMIAARSVIAMRVARSMPTARRGAGPRPAGQLLQAAGVHRARVRRRVRGGRAQRRRLGLRAEQVRDQGRRQQDCQGDDRDLSRLRHVCPSPTVRSIAWRWAAREGSSGAGAARRSPCPSLRCAHPIRTPPAGAL